MPYFTTRKRFLFPSFDLDEKDSQFFSRFYRLLEDSGVSNVINRYIKNNKGVGGRPNLNYYNLFAVIIYGFAFGRDTLRDLEDACKYDLRYIDISEQTRPSYSTFSHFINKVIVPNEEEIFKLLNNQIIKEMDIKLDDAFVDGSKFEANANKYKFVWKPTIFHERISVTFFNVLKEYDLCTTYDFEKLVKSKTITGAIDELIIKKDNYDNKTFDKILKSLESILLKVIEYEEKENICGDNRNSYYKTDYDATAMCLKSDYYSGLGSNMHAAYNTQIMVISGFVFSYYVSQSRADLHDFISVINKFYKFYGTYPKNICADSGYGSLENYRFLNEHKIGNYVKYQSWEGNVSGKNPDTYRLNDDLKTITCLNGNIGYIVNIDERHPKKSNSKFFQVEGCFDCAFKDYCMKFVKDNSIKTNRIFEVVIDLIKYKQESERNLLSVKGIELRINRSVQVEGVFGIEKQNRGYTRFRRRGLTNVSTEMMLSLLGLNIRKLFNYYKNGKILKYWVAPNILKPQEFKKPSSKKLSKKGKKTNERIYNSKQAKLV